ncbi:MAG TPA: LysM peptidoglycan-binding domain-containing protein [Candidatus Limnocylindrales bacterium]
MRRVVTGILALLFTGSVIGGAPVLLLRVAGNPLPKKVPSLDEITLILTSPDNGGLFLRAVALVCWLAWATFTVSVLIELGARVRGRRAKHVPGLGVQQKVAGALVGAIVAVFVGASMAHASTVPGRVQFAAVAATPAGTGMLAAGPAFVVKTPAVQQIQQAPKAQQSELLYVVRKGDYLGRIAERFTGDWDCYRDIAELNPHLVQNPNHIEPGWRLKLPADARDRGIMSHATGSMLLPDEAPPSKPPPPPPPAQETPKPTPTPTPTPSAEKTTEAASESESKDEEKKVPAPLAAGAGLAAASVLAAHVIVRRRQLRQTRIRVRKRRKVTTVFMPTVESAAKQMAKHRAVDRMDAGLRSLALALRGRAGDDMPDIAAVWQSAGDLAVILATGCQDPPDPFEEKWTNTWALASTVPLPESSWAPPLLPALMTFATWPQGGELLVDAERTGLLTITGDPQRCDNLLRCLAAEAATAPWSDGASILIAGMDPHDMQNLPMLGPSRVRTVASIPEALSRIAKRAAANASILREIGAPDTMAARIGNLTEGFWATHILFISDPWGEHSQQLRDLDHQLAGLKRVGVAVVAAHPTATRWSATVSNDSSLHMAWLAVAGANARQLSVEELALQLG